MIEMRIMKSFWNWLTGKGSKRQFEENSQAAFLVVMTS